MTIPAVSNRTDATLEISRSIHHNMIFHLPYAFFNFFKTSCYNKSFQLTHLDDCRPYYCHQYTSRSCSPTKQPSHYEWSRLPPPAPSSRPDHSSLYHSLFIVVFLFIHSLHPLVSTNAAVLQLFQYFYRIILNPTTPFFSSSNSNNEKTILLLYGSR